MIIHMGLHNRKLLLCLFVFSAVFGIGQKNEVPQIIFDTDMGGDIDDLGALYALNVYADQGKCNIKAVMSSWAMAFHVDGIDAVNTYFGRPDIPIGAHEDEWYEVEAYTWFLGEEFPHDITGRKAPKATELYREILSKSEDTSITIVVTGRLNNIEKLLKSGPDIHSKKNGIDLIKQKVKHLYIMGGGYAGQSFPESNFKWGGEGLTQYVIENCPSPMIFNGLEIGHADEGYATGERINDLSSGHILKEGYGYFFKNPPEWTRLAPDDTIKPWSIWDIITVQVAVTGVQDYFEEVSVGHNHVLKSGLNVWKDDPDKDHTYLIKKMEPEVYADKVIQSLLMTPALFQSRQ
ncbi:hypothetical protein FGF1_09910 [Flavobacteriaceae bacterium GF1]